MEPAIVQPELTMPDAEAAVLRGYYEQANVILEYGSGGSTVLASQMTDKYVISLESSKEWWTMMMEWLDLNPCAENTKVDMIWADIGPTKEWGFPKNDRRWERFANYPLAVWDMEDFHHPDLVLVDGRFRVGCALATAFRITRPTKLLVDDYVQRKFMHVLEKFIGKPKLWGRMAEFQLKPQPIPANRLLEIIKFMQRP